MSRPSKNNADYFPHFTSLRNHRKVKALRNRFGQVQGYAFYTIMLEWLSEQDGLRWECTEFEAEMFAAELGVSAAETRLMVDFCLRLDLLSMDEEGFIYSKGLIKQLSPLFEKRDRERRRYEKAMEKTETGVSAKNTGRNPTVSRVSAAETLVSVTETPHRRVEESRVEESKEKTSFLSNSVVEKPTTLTHKENEAAEVLSSSSLTDEEREKEKSSAKKEKPQLEESADGSFVCLELRAMIVEFRKEKKGLYTDEMYKAFALHWSEPNGRGVPKWMVTKKKSGTFHLPGRLAKWNENDYDNKTKLTDGKSKQRNGGPLRSTAKAQPVYRGKGSTLNVEL